MDTICSKCIFAKYTKSKQQIGCEVGRLEKFTDQGVKLELQTVEDKTCYVIKDRICTMCCTEEAAKKHDMKNPKEDVRNLIALKASIYIVYDDEHSLDDLRQTVLSCINQEYKPSLINIINNQSHVKNTGLLSKFLRDEEAKQPFTWNITRILERGQEGERPSREWCLDHAIEKCETPFYAVFLSGFLVPADYLKKIDVALNDNVDRFSMLYPVDEWNGAFVQTQLHRQMSGNLPMTLEEYEDGALIATSIMDKIEFFAEKNDQKHMLRKAEEICPSIKT